MKTDAQVRALKEEIQAWMVKNRLTEETSWRTPAQVYGDEHKTFLHPYYLILCTEGDLYNMLWGYPLDEPDGRNAGQLKQEFDAILAKHGCRREWKNYVTLCIMDREERKTTG